MQLKPLKSWCAFVLRIATVCALTATAHAELLDISVIKAPVAPDGTTAAAPTDFVLTFRDRDPAEPGISMMTGGTVTVTLPDAFTSGPGGNLILLQGWPQSPPAPPPLFPWTTVIDGNTVTSTITSDYL